MITIDILDSGSSNIDKVIFEELEDNFIELKKIFEENKKVISITTEIKNNFILSPKSLEYLSEDRIVQRTNTSLNEIKGKLKQISDLIGEYLKDKDRCSKNNIGKNRINALKERKANIEHIIINSEATQVNNNLDIEKKMGQFLYQVREKKITSLDIYRELIRILSLID